jgi:hypothetical protein
MNLIVFLKFIFSVILLILFFYFFGLPSWYKFEAGKVMVNKRKISNIDSVTPALTVCALEQESSRGWKYDQWIDLKLKKEVAKHNDLTINCNGSNEVAQCVNYKTYNLTETINEFQAGRGNQILQSKYWIEELSFFMFGKCHTLKNSVPLNTNFWSIDFNKSLNYFVMIHDPNYFMMTANPETVPMIFLDLDGLENVQLYAFLKVVKHINLDRPDQPCSDKDDYSFTACVKNSVTKRIGCRYLEA